MTGMRSKTGLGIALISAVKSVDFSCTFGTSRQSLWRRLAVPRSFIVSMTLIFTDTRLTDESILKNTSAGSRAESGPEYDDTCDERSEPLGGGCL